MNPYVCVVTCDICGEEASATPKTAAASWKAGVTIAHKDPRVCAYNLKYKKEEEQGRRYRDLIKKNMII